MTPIFFTLVMFGLRLDERMDGRKCVCATEKRDRYCQIKPVKGTKHQILYVSTEDGKPAMAAVGVLCKGTK